MASVNRAARDRVLSLTSAVTRVAGQIISILVIARIFPPAQFGLMSLYLALAGLAGLLGDFGTGNAALPVMSIAGKAIGATFKDFLVFRTITITVILGGSAAGYVLFAKVADPVLFLMCCAITYLSSMADFSLLPFRSAQLYKDEAIASVASTIIYVCSVPIAALITRDIHYVALALVVARFLLLVVIHMIWRRSLARLNFPAGHYRLKPDDLPKKIRDYVPFLLDSFFSAAINFIDTLLIGYMIGPKAVGIYQIPSRFVQGTLLIVQIAVSIHVPALVRVSSAAEWQARTRHMFIELATIGILVAAGLTFVIPTVADRVFGPSYHLDQLAWLGFGIALLLRLLAAGHGIILIAEKRPSARATGQVLVLMTFCTGAFLSARMFQLTGVAWSFATAMFVALLFYYRQTRNSRFGAWHPADIELAS